MKRSDIKIGGKYMAKVSGKRVVVEVLRENPPRHWAGKENHGGWEGKNLSTGHFIRIRTAGRLSPIPTRTPQTTPLHVEKRVAYVLGASDSPCKACRDFSIDPQAHDEGCPGRNQGWEKSKPGGPPNRDEQAEWTPEDRKNFAKGEGFPIDEEAGDAEDALSDGGEDDPGAGVLNIPHLGLPEAAPLIPPGGLLSRLASYSEDLSRGHVVVTFGPGSILEHFECGRVVVEAGNLMKVFLEHLTEGVLTPPEKEVVWRLQEALRKLERAVEGPEPKDLSDEARLEVMEGIADGTLDPKTGRARS